MKEYFKLVNTEKYQILIEKGFDEDDGKHTLTIKSKIEVDEILMTPNVILSFVEPYELDKAFEAALDSEDKIENFVKFLDEQYEKIAAFE